RRPVLFAQQDDVLHANHYSTLTGYKTPVYAYSRLQTECLRPRAAEGESDMNGSDLLLYSLMKQHQTKLLREARGLHLARTVTRTARSAGGVADPEAQRTALDPKSIGVLRPGGGGRARARGLDAVGSLQARPAPLQLRRLAARVG